MGSRVGWFDGVYIRAEVMVSRKIGLPCLDTYLLYYAYVCRMVWDHRFAILKDKELTLEGDEVEVNVENDKEPNGGRRETNK